MILCLGFSIEWKMILLLIFHREWSKKYKNLYNEHVPCQLFVVHVIEVFFAAQCQVFVQAAPPRNVIGTIYNFKARQTANSEHKSLTPGKSKVVILYRHLWQLFIFFLLYLSRIYWIISSQIDYSTNEK